MKSISYLKNKRNASFALHLGYRFKKNCKPKKKRLQSLQTAQDVRPQCDRPACLGNDHLCAGLVELLPQLPLVKSHLDVLNVLRTMKREAIRVAGENI